MQNIHSKNLFIQKNENYSFKEDIHSSEKWIIAQGYPDLVNVLTVLTVETEETLKTLRL